MHGVNQQLLDYIQEQTKAGVSAANIKRTLLENEWQEPVIDEALATLGIAIPTLQAQESGGYFQDRTKEGGDIEAAPQSSEAIDTTFARENITMDKIIEKFIPLAGALFLIVGFGYLIYANAWVFLPMEIRLGLGFFFSIAIIGGSFSLSDKMRYFTDIGIGSGVLLLYGTLIYGSRTTELATAMIPEVVTLITAVLFTIGVSYFASKRNSKAILLLGMIGAYITPFVIGQNDVWVENISFNAYLIYFLATNVSVFLIGREISVRDIIPLNILGLFVGVSTLWGLAASDGVNTVRPENIFTGELFTAILFFILVVFSMWSILLSAQRFKEKDDGYLSLGYIAPVIWFAYNVDNLASLSDITVGIFYVLIAASCFTGWHVLKDTNAKLQHTAIYAAGLISVFLAIFSFFNDFTVYTSMLIAYSSLVFGVLYMFDSSRPERFLSYIVVSLAGSILSLKHILEADLQFETVFIVVALLPAMAAYFIAKNGEQANLVPGAKIYSFVWSLVAVMYILADIIEYVDLNFLLFYVVPLILLTYLAFVQITAPDNVSHDSKSKLLRVILFWFAFGFIGVFFELVVSVYPAPTDVYLFTDAGGAIDWILIKGLFATAILFVGLFISRRLQLEQVIKRPSFILVIFGFATLVLVGNYIISAIANDLDVSLESGGPRAIATTLWWATVAIFMLFKGIKYGKKYHAEKLLGLLLLAVTMGKMILYDISTMDMQNKIIVLMLVGGAMLIFSYFIKAKGLLKTEDSEDAVSGQ